MIRIHLDTDIGGDPDDLCALTMLLGWPGVQLVGVTTSIDPDGMRAAYVKYVLGLLGRTDVPFAAGAPLSITTGIRADPEVGDARYWPASTTAAPSDPGAATRLLLRGLDRGATLVVTGPQTNLALLEQAHPGALASGRIIVMGGWITPPEPDLPQWGPDMDFNVQWDTRAAETLFTSATDLTLVPLPPTLKACIRAADTPRLNASGPVGRLIAKQSAARSEAPELSGIGAAHAGLHDDLLNFHYDPVTCGVAAGWEGAKVEDMRLKTTYKGELLCFVPDPDGRLTHVVTDIDGGAFSRAWLEAVETAQKGAIGVSASGWIP